MAGMVTIGAMHYGTDEPLMTEAGLMLKPCDCCKRPQPSDWLRSEPSSDLFPRGRLLCGTCFNHCLFTEHRVRQPAVRQ